MNRTPGHTLAPKMQVYIDRLGQNRLNSMGDTHRSKRGPPEPVEDFDPVKRQKLGADSPPPLKVLPLPEGTVSFDQLFTLTEDMGLSSFDVKQLPADMIVNITVAVLLRVDTSALNQAVDVRAYKSRYLIPLPPSFNMRTSFLRTFN
jgi:symplekin